MPLFAFGIDLDRSVRKPRWFEAFNLKPRLLQKIASELAFDELFLLKAKQKLAVFVACEDRYKFESDFYQVLERECKLSPAASTDRRWRLEGSEAVRQFFRFAIGIEEPADLTDSVDRFRKCFVVCKTARLTGPVLNRLYLRGIWLSEKIRLELNLQKNTVTPESVVTDLAQKIFGDLRDHRALIVSSGLQCEPFVQKLYDRGIGALYFSDSEARAIEGLARDYEGETIGPEQLPRLLPTVDLVLIFDAKRLELLQSKRLHQIMSQRHNAPLLLISYVEDASQLQEQDRLSKIYNLYYYTRSDLQEIVAANLKEHLKVIQLVNDLIDLEVKDFLGSMQATERYRFGKIIGKSMAMQNILELIARVAQTDTTVLVDGESGTGKELVARAIHDHSTRAKNPFVVVNCGAMPENLLESELFGHVRGAFTGATSNKKGLFEVANHGTILLDEIGETSLAMQVKLLRFLQEGEIKPVGSNQTIKLDVRLIAATNRDLQQMVEDGIFRRDLYYRLNVIQITIPPLRERREDILPLAEYFVKLYANKIHKTVYGLDDEAAQLLCKYDWPGNVRELENAIERAVALTSSKVLTKEDLPPSVAEGGLATNGKFLSKTMTLKELEKNYIEATLKEHNWNYELVTRILGIGRTTLWRKMKEYHLSSAPKSQKKAADI